MSGGIGTVLWMLLATVLILVLAGASTRWIARHGVPFQALQGGGTEQFRLLSQIAVGRNERLALVRVGSRCLLLGVTEHQITLLGELDDGEAAAWLTAPEQPSPPAFLDFLQTAIRKRNGNEREP